jgi:hypothetical protein
MILGLPLFCQDPVGFLLDGVVLYLAHPHQGVKWDLEPQHCFGISGSKIILLKFK